MLEKESNEYIIRNTNRKVLIRYSNDRDNISLINIFKNHPVSSSLSYVVDRSPDFNNLHKLQGFDYKVIISEEENKVKGSLSLLFDRVYLNGKESISTYTCDLKLEHDLRKTGVADRLMREGFHCTRDLYPDSKIFTSILKDNKAGFKKNQNLSNLVKMNLLGEVNSYFFVLLSKKIKKNNKYTIRPSTENDVEEMVNLWQKVKKENYNLARSYTIESFKKMIHNTPNLSYNDFLLAIKDNKIVGFTGLWNQHPVRKIVITSEQSIMKTIRLIRNLYGLFVKLPEFPQINKPLNFYCMLHLCISPENIDCFADILSNACKIVFEKNSMFLALALDKKDPLNTYASKLISDKGQLLLLGELAPEDMDKDKLFHVEISLG